MGFDVEGGGLRRFGKRFGHFLGFAHLGQHPEVVRQHAPRQGQFAMRKTLGPQGPRTVTEIKTAQDALLISLGERGRVDLEHVASLLKKRVADVVPELKGAIYFNPQTDRWETEDEYRSGNVRAKLAAAEAAVQFLLGGGVVAIGTSLPEFIKAITSTRENIFDLAAGNVLGANIANLTLAVLTPRGSAALPVIA